MSRLGAPKSEARFHPPFLPTPDEAPLDAPRLRVEMTIDEDALPRALAAGSTGAGVFVPISRRIPIGRAVDLRVKSHDGRPLARIAGEVSWVRAPGAHPTFPAGIGVKVLSMTFESPRWIARLCSDLHAESRECAASETSMSLAIECPRCRLAMEMHEHLTLVKCAGCGAMLSSDD